MKSFKTFVNELIGESVVELENSTTLNKFGSSYFLVKENKIIQKLTNKTEIEALYEAIKLGYKLNSFEYIREKYINHEIFNIGDLVEYNNQYAQIANRGSNYVTLLLDGIEVRAWLNEIVPLFSNTKKTLLENIFDNTPKIIDSETYQYLKDLAKNEGDAYAIYNAFASINELLKYQDKELSLEDFNSAKIEYERAVKYMQKFNIPLSGISDIEDVLLLYAIENDKKIKINKEKIEKVITSSLNIEKQDTFEDTVNLAAKKVKESSFSKDVWLFFGKLFNKATEAGINWNKNIFSPNMQKFMGLKGA